MKSEQYLSAIKRLIKQYKGRKHPLRFRNWYELIVAVVLAARATDERVNQLAPKLFEVYPTFSELAEAKPEELFPYIGGLTNFANKAKWLIGIAKELKERNSSGTVSSNIQLDKSSSFPLPKASKTYFFLSSPMILAKADIEVSPYEVVRNSRSNLVVRHSYDLILKIYFDNFK
jgi:hypothetical protein